MGRHDVVVIGGGIIGLLTALMVKQRGLDVIVIAGEDVKKSSSWGNAGYLAASFGSPIPSAESISQILKWIITGDTPIKVSPKFFIREIMPNGWLATYLRNLRKISSHKYATIVRKACIEGVGLLKQIIEELKLQTDLRSDGIIEVYLNERNLIDHIKLLEKAKHLAIDFKYVDRDTCLEEEPLLSKDIVGGILFKEDLSLTPSKLILSLRSTLVSKAVEVIDKEVVKINPNGRSISSVILSDGSVIVGSTYVVCAGVKTRKLLSQIGIAIPIVPAYGYMIMTEPVYLRLRRPTAGGEFRVAISQTGEGKLRATGFFELSHDENPPIIERCELLKRKASQYIPIFGRLKIEEKWVGARPCTPDGLPYVGRVKYDNLFVAAGHCRLGMTMGASTAKLIADQLMGVENPFSSAFDPRREF